MRKIYRLRDKDIQQLATLTKTDQDAMMRLVSMGLIDHTPAISLLVKYSVQKLKRKKYYKMKQIVAAVAVEYGVTIAFVNNAIYGKKSKTYYCEECMRKISAWQYKHNDGLCDDCVAKHIIID